MIGTLFHVDSISGCAWRLRIIAAIVAFVVGGAFLWQSTRYHRDIDAIMRIPFVFGSLAIGLIVIGFGVRVLLPKR